MFNEARFKTPERFVSKKTKNPDNLCHKDFPLSTMKSIFIVKSDIRNTILFFLSHRMRLSH